MFWLLLLLLCRIIVCIALILFVCSYIFTSFWWFPWLDWLTVCDLVLDLVLCGYIVVDVCGLGILLRFWLLLGCLLWGFPCWVVLLWLAVYCVFCVIAWIICLLVCLLHLSFTWCYLFVVYVRVVCRCFPLDFACFCFRFWRYSDCVFLWIYYLVIDLLLISFGFDVSEFSYFGVYAVCAV